VIAAVMAGLDAAFELRHDPVQERRATQAVALGGEAWVRDPSRETVALLADYLALPVVDRRGDAGLAILLTLVERGETPLALSAVARLAGIAQLDDRLSAEGARQLARSLLREDAEGDLGHALVELLRHRGGRVAQRALERELRRDANDAPLPPRFYDALGAVAGALPETEARALLASPEPARRAVATRYAAGPEAPAALRERLASDPAPRVRVAAIERLAGLEGEAALRDALDALNDEDAGVRNAAARTAAALGTAGVAGLRSVVFAETGAPVRPGGAPTTVAARNAAIGGLGSAGREGRRALIEVARTHPDESLKRLATMALGYGRHSHH